MTARRDSLESKIQREIELALGAEPDLLLLRNSVGEAAFFNRDGKRYQVPYGLGVGSPDLVGLLLGGGSCAVWFCLEVKRPDEDLTKDQVKCHEVWRRFGALVFVVRSVDEACAALQTARGRARR